MNQACTRKVVTSISHQELPVNIAPVNHDSYRIKSGDILSVQNLNWLTKLIPEPSATSNASSEGIELTVSQHGNVILPEIGHYAAAGLTTSQFSDSLAKKYSNILRNPIFETKVINWKVKVLGAVSSQGLVSLTNEMQSLGEILALSGGINFTTAGNTIQIIRGEGTSQRVIKYNFDELGDPLIMNQPVFDNDIVYVPPSNEAIRSVRVQRNIILLQPVLILMNMTVLLVNILR